MQLTKLIAHLSPTAVHGSLLRDIASLELDSRSIEAGQLFVALRGEATDGHRYIDNAIARGATAVLCEQLPAQINGETCYIVVADAHKALGILADAFYEHPSQQLKLTGITGTNGKTTTATLLYRLMQAMGEKAGLLSTVTNFVANREIAATHTTPDAITLNRLLREMVDAGCTHCFMEVSSHAIVQERIAGLHFTGGVFTNITHEHLDYHKTFPEYIRAKKQFFDTLPPTAFALTNVDDKNGRVMLQNTAARKHTYALRTPADYTCRVVESTFTGMQLLINHTEVWTRFIGTFNACNLLAVAATAQLLGADRLETLRLLSAMDPVAGRFECIRGKGDVIAIVDYAHTPDALENVLHTINHIRRKTGEPLITVVGCGGNRDTTKRPVMARLAAELSDKIIFTSDNPRNETPEAILDDMKAGLNNAQRSRSLFIVDRREAIRTAIMLAQPGTIVLIAGKGHERYQEIQGVRTPFDDREEVTALLNGEWRMENGE